jgi:hypothetical protein
VDARHRRSLAAVETARHRQLAYLVAWGRVGLGVTAAVAPNLVARPWIGEAADSNGARLLARAMGGRDLALGLGTLRGLAQSDQTGRPWVALSGLADGIDALVTLMAFRSLPRRSRWGIAALTIGAAAVSVRAASALDSEPDDRIA